MQLLDIVKKGSTDRSVTIRIIDSTDGTPETAVEHNTSGIDLWYRREGAAKVSITEAALSALTEAHSDGGIEHIGDGYYRLDLPDAAFATGANHVDIGGTVTGMIVIGGRVKLVNYDPEDTVRLGLTALPSAAADAPGGLPISDAGGLAMDTLAADLAALKKNAFIGIEFAIGTVTSQTVFVLTGGPANDIDNVMAIFFDQSASDAPVVAEGSYVGSTGTLTLTEATDITITTSDTVTLVAVAAETSATAIRAAIGLASANLDTQLGTIDTNVDAILADTTVIGSPAGASVSADIAAIKAQTAAIEVDTQDLQTQVGTDGAGLTNLPWNASWDAEVQSEVQDAIEANHLDHLLAATYDPASKPGAADALLNELVENDGGVSRFTVNSLENAPSGTGASAASIRAEIDANSTQLAAILADTAELQTDWANGGRLDLILDTAAAGGGLDAAGVRSAIGLASANLDTQLSTIDTVVDSILVDTAVIGAAGAGLTAVPWNASWDAEVQSECTDALNAYDPPTKAEVDTSVAALLTTVLADAYAAHGNAPTLQQCLMWIHQSLDDRAASGTTITVKKIDGTTAGTLTVNDATDPTSITRAT